MDALREGREAIEHGPEPEVAPLGPEALLRRAVEASPLPTVFTRGAEHLVHHANPAFCRLVAGSLEDLEGDPLVEFFEEPGALAALLDRVDESGINDCASGLRRVIDGGKTVHCIAIACSLLDEWARPFGLVVHFIDTTDQAVPRSREAQAAEELRHANEALVLAGLREQDLAERATRLYEEAQRATRAREDLLAIVSHDLKSPLGVMLMTIDMLMKSSGRGDRDKSLMQLERMKRSARRMSRLIDDLLDAASIEAGSLSVERRRLDLAPLVAEAIEAFQPLAASRFLDLRNEVPTSLPPVSADPVRVQQVFTNLLGNALKFTPDRGTVTVRAEPLADGIKLSVEDTGPGIAAEDLPRLFDRFWHASTAGQRGTGLGLFIVRGIVEAHGGRVGVESQVGVGSTFHFTLRVAPEG